MLTIDVWFDVQEAALSGILEGVGATIFVHLLHRVELIADCVTLVTQRAILVNGELVGGPGVQSTESSLCHGRPILELANLNFALGQLADGEGRVQRRGSKLDLRGRILHGWRVPALLTILSLILVWYFVMFFVSFVGVVLSIDRGVVVFDTSRFLSQVPSSCVAKHLWQSFGIQSLIVEVNTTVNKDLIASIGRLSGI